MKQLLIVLKKLRRNNPFEMFSVDNLGLRRPGNGLPPSMFEQVCGKRSSKNILKGGLVKSGDFI